MKLFGTLILIMSMMGCSPHNTPDNADNKTVQLAETNQAIFTLAQKCGDISGTYVYPEMQGELKVSQVNCDSVEFELINSDGRFKDTTVLGEIATFQTGNQPNHPGPKPGLVSQKIQIKNNMVLKNSTTTIKIKILPSKGSGLNFIYITKLKHHDGSKFNVYNVITIQPKNSEYGNYKILTQEYTSVDDFEF